MFSIVDTIVNNILQRLLRNRNTNSCYSFFKYNLPFRQPIHILKNSLEMPGWNQSQLILVILMRLNETRYPSFYRHPLLMKNRNGWKVRNLWLIKPRGARIVASQGFTWGPHQSLWRLCQLPKTLSSHNRKWLLVSFKSAFWGQRRATALPQPQNTFRTWPEAINCHIRKVHWDKEGPLYYEI